MSENLVLALLVGLSVLAVLQGVAIIALFREAGTLFEYMESGLATISLLPVGSKAPSFGSQLTVRGESIASADFHGRRTVLLFLSGDCDVCRNIASNLTSCAFVSPNPELDSACLVVFWRGSERRRLLYLSQLPDDVPIVTTEETTIETDFRVRGYPVAISVDSDWMISRVIHPTRTKDVLDMMMRTQQPEVKEYQVLVG